VVTSYLNDKDVYSRWFLPINLNIFLRAVGQPAFVNNPLLGLLILVAIFLFNWQVGLGCILGGGVATLTEVVLGLHPWDLVGNGVCSFNGVLVGTVISILYPGVYGVERSTGMWVAIVIGAVTSVFFASAFNNFLSKVNVPYMALPFNIIAVCVFLSLQPNPQIEITEKMTFNASDPYCGDGSVSWCGVGRGVIVSMGQVYAVDAVVPSLVMNLAVLLASPLLFTMSTLGATIGSLMALTILPEEEFHQVYSGLWGYNALLSMAAVSCVFFPFSPAAFMAGIVNTFATVGIQAGLKANMDKNHLPVFTLPMTLCTLVMLMAAQSRPSKCGSPLARTEVMSYPEKQAVQAWRSAKQTVYHQCNQKCLRRWWIQCWLRMSAWKCVKGRRKPS